MGKVDFVKLFGGKEAGDEIVDTFELNESFPLPESITARNDGDLILSCFLSLSCPTCIEILPELSGLFAMYEMNVVLFIYGLEEEINGIKEHFGYNFPVVRIEDNELIDKYKVPVTPYVYILSDEKKVLHKADFDTQDELKNICNGYFR